MSRTFISDEWNIEDLSSERLTSNQFNIGDLTWSIKLKKAEGQLLFSLNLVTQLSEESHLVLFTLALSEDPVRRADVLYEFTDEKTTVDKLVDVHVVCPLKLTYKLQIIDRDELRHLRGCLDFQDWQGLVCFYGKEVESTLKQFIDEEKKDKREIIGQHWSMFCAYWNRKIESQSLIARLKPGTETKDIVDDLLKALQITHLVIVESLCLVVSRLKNDGVMKMDEDGDIVVDTCNFLYYFQKAYEDTHGDEIDGSIGHVLKLARCSIQLMVFEKVVKGFDEMMGFPKKGAKKNEQSQSRLMARNKVKMIPPKKKISQEELEISKKAAEEMGNLLIKEEEDAAAKKGKGKAGPSRSTDQRKSKGHRKGVGVEPTGTDKMGPRRGNQSTLLARVGN